jgi:1-aminocyclopropane-1-carboxylate deaminase/D-cysteine desulfhydrase-like pyridoxal-dependent ACC family enzyme
MRTEGLMLDPVYTAKAFAVVLDMIDAGAGPIVFWHTGGLLAAAAHLGGK